MRLALARPAALQARMVHFVGNHDEARTVAAFGPPRSLAAAAAGLLTPGARLVHHGQLAGWRVKMPVQLGRLPGEATDVEVEPFYQALLAEAHQPMYHDGIFTLINGWSEDILVCAWALGNNWRLIVLNYTNHPARTSIALPAGLLPAPLMPTRAILSGASTTLEGGQLELALMPAFGVQIWRPC